MSTCSVVRLKSIYFPLLLLYLIHKGFATARNPAKLSLTLLRSIPTIIQIYLVGVSFSVVEGHCLSRLPLLLVHGTVKGYRLPWPDELLTVGHECLDPS